VGVRPNKKCAVFPRAYPASFAQSYESQKYLIIRAHPTRFERVTLPSEGNCGARIFQCSLNIYFIGGFVKGNITAPLEPRSWIGEIERQHLVVECFVEDGEMDHLLTVAIAKAQHHPALDLLNRAIAAGIKLDASRPIHSDCRVEVLEFDTGIGG
jgi:hypothetical protein